MKKRIELNEIFFGKIDALNELNECGPDFFVDSFVNNSRYHIDDFLSGEKYYICGKKGTGKTAFLRYLECTLNTPENLIIPIRFKSDFDDIDKDAIVKMTSNDNESDGKSFQESYATDNLISLKSYILMWKSFLINQILMNAEFGEYSVFQDNDNYRQLRTLLGVLYGDQKKSIMPRLTKGSIVLNGALASKLSASIQVDIDFDKKTEKANYQKTAKKIYELFKELIFDKTEVYVFIDELELSVRNKSIYEKDIMLVRDLILAIDDLNKTCSQKCFNIHFISSIRSEVINSVLSSGYEINKCVEDYGVTIDWFQKGGDYKDNDLLKIIENKIHASEKQNHIESTKNVWTVYFESPIHKTEVRKYILNNTWYRPRDIVRLMGLLKNYSDGFKCFSQRSFDSAQQEYSNKMWNELCEEMRLSYTAEDVEAIRIFLNRIKLPFTFNYLVERAKTMGEIYPEIKSFFEKENMANFLKKMFSLGVIGNTGKRMVFSFLGDRDISLVDPMVIHNPLRNFFAVQSIKEQE